MNLPFLRHLCIALVFTGVHAGRAQDAGEPKETIPLLPPNHQRMPGDIVKVEAKSAWRYLNPLNGEDPGKTVQGFHTNWTKLTFDDSKWSKSKDGFIGYGHFSLNERVKTAPFSEMGTPENGKRFTAYLRHIFTVDKSGQYDIDFVFSRDDAAIIYINGKEAARSFEPGAVEFSKAPDTYDLLVAGRKDAWTDGASELTPHQHILRNVTLHTGNNILALSVHNCLNTKEPTSSDLGVLVRYLSIAPAGAADKMKESAPPETQPEPLPQVPLVQGEAAPSAFDDLSRDAAAWEIDAGRLEAHFAGHRLVWQDTGKTQAQIIPVKDGDSPLTLLNAKLPVVECSLWLTGGRLSRQQYLIYTRGDSGEVSKTAYTALVEKCKAALTEAAGGPGKDRPVAEAPKAAVRTTGTTWSSASTLYQLEISARRERNGEAFTPEFIRLVMVPAKTKPPLGGAPAAASPGVKRGDLTANVLKPDSGDVYIHNVPMVDQGEKGYCAVASAERVLRYFGIAVDQHELAQIAGTSATTGTNPEAMFEALKKLRGRFHIQLREDIPWSYDNFIKLVKDYNTYVKKTGEGEYVQYPRDGNTDEVVETMQGSILKSVRARKEDVAAFHKKIVTSLNVGIPLLWGVQLGIFPEPGLPQTSGGHMRLIIGYNDKTGHVIYSDSWGAGHELKRMPMDQATSITFQLHVIRPSQ